MPESTAARRPRLDLVGTLLAAAGDGTADLPADPGAERGLAAVDLPHDRGQSWSPSVRWSLWTRRARRLGRDPLVEPSIFGHRAYCGRPRQHRRVLRRHDRHAAGPHPLPAVRRAFLGHPRRPDPRPVRRRLGHRRPRWPQPFWCPGSAAPSFRSAAVIIAGGDLVAPRRDRRPRTLAPPPCRWSPPQLVLGLGIGMLISPLFGFILASVTDDEVGSASGVLNACQQLAGAVGVAVIGTIFFAVLGHAGFRRRGQPLPPGRAVHHARPGGPHRPAAPSGP